MGSRARKDRPRSKSPKPVDVDRINKINIGLMLGAAALACALPFEVFLLSYAILGPLHYLTQISWLHDRGYYSTGRFDWIPLALLGALGFVSVYTGWVDWDGAVFVAFGGGIAAAFVRNPAIKLACLGALAFLATTVQRWTPAEVFFTVLLASVVHVYVLTGLFILAGSLRSRTTSGFVSLAVYVACGVGLLFAQPSAAAYHVSERTVGNLNGFGSLFEAMAGLVPGHGSRDAMIAIGRFLAFAYTYHYLNWFSKTGIIRWHEMSRTRAAIIGVVYLASIGLYAYDYRTGLKALFFLSVTHVFLEFPLDARTIVEVTTAIRRLGRVSAPAAPADPRLRAWRRAGDAR